MFLGLDKISENPWIDQRDTGGNDSPGTLMRGVVSTYGCFFPTCDVGSGAEVDGGYVELSFGLKSALFLFGGSWIERAAWGNAWMI